MSATRSKRVILLALVLAAAAAFLAYTLLSQRTAPPPTIVEVTPESGVPVVVSARAIGVGETIGPADVRIAYIAQDELHQRALSEVARVSGRAAIAAIPAGEQIVVGMIGEAPTPTPNTFSRQIPPGLRAVSIPTNPQANAAGFVLPGDRVDVLAVYTPLAEPAGPGTVVPNPQTVAELVLQDVEVFAVDQAVRPSGPPPPPADPNAPAPGPVALPAATMVTFLLPPSEAVRLILAEQAGSAFRLLLRTPGDDTLLSLPPATLKDGMNETPVLGQAFIDQDLVITEARFREDSLPAGGILRFEVKVRNVSDTVIAAGRGGVPDGHVYRRGQSWDTLQDPFQAGIHTVGVTTTGTTPPTYPWRWRLPRDLGPGESATVTGGIQLPNAAGSQPWWFGIVLQPGTVVQDGASPAPVTIEPAVAVAAIVDGLELRSQPWNDAPAVGPFPRDAVADVLDHADGWYLLRFRASEGWAPEGSVRNVAAIDDPTGEAEPAAPADNQQGGPR